MALGNAPAHKNTVKYGITLLSPINPNCCLGLLKWVTAEKQPVCKLQIKSMWLTSTISSQWGFSQKGCRHSSYYSGLTAWSWETDVTLLKCCAKTHACWVLKWGLSLKTIPQDDCTNSLSTSWAWQLRSGKQSLKPLKTKGCLETMTSELGIQGARQYQQQALRPPKRWVTNLNMLRCFLNVQPNFAMRAMCHSSWVYTKVNNKPSSKRKG